MDDISVKLLLYFFGTLALVCVGMVVDSTVTNYFRYKAIDRVLTTMEIAMEAGLLTRPSSKSASRTCQTNYLKRKNDVNGNKPFHVSRYRGACRCHSSLGACHEG